MCHTHTGACSFSAKSHQHQDIPFLPFLSCFLLKGIFIIIYVLCQSALARGEAQRNERGRGAHPKGVDQEKEYIIRILRALFVCHLFRPLLLFSVPGGHGIKTK